jgi:uncharacterized protein (TIGR02757 family)
VSRRPPPPPPAPHPGLGPALGHLVATADPAARLARDPLRFARAFSRPEDQELAGLFAALLAFGRVAAFGPVLTRVLGLAAARGGPAAWIDGFSPADAEALAPLVYRWVRGPHLIALCHALRTLRARHGSLGAAALALDPPGAPTLGPLARALSAALHEALPTPAPRPLKMLLGPPGGASAGKRWCLYLRWMVRPPGPGAAGVDLGLWPLSPARLVIPLDTHVHRIARLVGLTARPDPSWATAVEITGALARFSPEDPTRYDFALAHLGISGECTSAFVPAVCAACALRPVCTVPPAAPAG